MDKREMEDTYEKLRESYGRLTEEVKYILERELKDIQIHNVTSRVKTFDSLYDKAIRKQVADPFKNLVDISGVRVICLFLSDLDRIRKIIEANLLVWQVDNKVFDGPPNEFGYMSEHYVVKIPKSYTGKRYEGIHDLLCEIQVRTIAMDAWATISHYLTYKRDGDTPQSLRRDFNALSGLLLIADRHFERLAEQTAMSKKTASLLSRSEEKFDRSELNLDTLVALLDAIYPDRDQEHSGHYSQLLSELLLKGYDTIGSIRRDLEAGNEQLLRYEATLPNGVRLATVGAARRAIESVRRD